MKILKYLTIIFAPLLITSLVILSIFFFISPPQEYGYYLIGYILGQYIFALFFSVIILIPYYIILIIVWAVRRGKY